MDRIVVSKQSFMNTHHHKRFHAPFFRFHALLSLVTILAISGAVDAQSPVGTVNIPDPSINAYTTSLRYDSSGNLYAWDGVSVWMLSASGGTFSKIGSVTADNSADAGPINFSQDGKTLLLGNGSGGFQMAGLGVFWTMSASGGAGEQVAGGVPYNYDAVPLPKTSSIPGSGTKYLVDEGNSYWNGSTVSLFDAATGSNQVVIGGIPGASASIAINPKNNSVYVNVGYGNDVGDIRSFSLAAITAAYNSGNPQPFASGPQFDSTGTGFQNGGGMFFDSNGYLFSGGDGVTVFRPNGTIFYNQANDGPYGFAWLSYDPANNRVLAVPDDGSQMATLYNAGEFEPGAWTATSGTTGSWKKGDNWLNATVPTSGTAAATFAGTLGTPIRVTLDGNQSAGPLVFDVSGTNGFTLSQGSGGGALTLGTSAGASITVVSGRHSISAPIVLAGSLAVSTSAGGFLDLSGNVSQATGVSAALTLSGGGELILSGTNSYSGGTTVDSGTLYVTNSSALPNGTSLTVGAGGVFIFDPSVTRAGSPLAVPAGAVAVVPEPGTLGLLAAGCVCFIAGRFLRRRRVE